MDTTSDTDAQDIQTALNNQGDTTISEEDARAQEQAKNQEEADGTNP